jgi:superfamily II RNA helicase
MSDISDNKYYEILKGDCNKIIDDPPISFPFECENFQKLCFQAILEKKNIYVSVPTGMGKTVPALFAMAHHIRNGGRVIYVSPIVELSNQKCREFTEKLKTTIGLLTGDNKIDVDSKVLIVTAEILDNALFKLRAPFDSTKKEDVKINQSFVDSITCVIFDEAHFMNDTYRGTVWEQIIINLKPEIQLLFLSATAPNVKNIAKWIGMIKNKPTYIISETKRYVPLRHYLFSGKKPHLILDENDKYNESIYHIAKKEYEIEKKEREKKHKNYIDYNLLNETVKYLKDHNLLQSLFFTFSTKKCEEFAKMITISLLTPDESHNALSLFDSLISKHKKDYEILPDYITIRSLISKGIAFHYRELAPIIKDCVGIIFGMGLIKILFATETFAVGINAPTRSVVFTDLTKPTENGKRILNSAEYRQMSGRAGRRGFDTEGSVFILPLYTFPDSSELKSTMLGGMPAITSKLTINYQFILKTLQSELTNYDQIFSNSLLNHQNDEQKKGIIKEYEDNQTQLEKFFKFFDLSDKTNDILNQIYELENINKSSFGSFAITRSKKQDKDLSKFKQQLKKDGNEKLYEEFCKYKKEQINIKNMENTIKSYDNYSYDSREPLLLVLQELGYVDDKKEPTIKGIIASHINECNGILLTEIVMEGLLNDLDIYEIIGFIGIFCSKNMNNDDLISDISEILNINKKINYIKKYIDHIQKIESKFGLVNQPIIINPSYIHIPYLWSKGATVREILVELQNTDILVGNFIRNMLKISKIIDNILAICKMIHNNELIMKLEKADSLILRDIVNTASLYL